MRWRRLIFFCSLFLICSNGCHTKGLSVKRFYVDRDSLASTFVGSPDPRQIDPPKGEQLVIRWHVPTEITLDQLQLMLTIVYQDDSQATFTYPVNRRQGIISYTLLGRDYVEKGGLLIYRAQIINAKGDALQKWEHMLWFNRMLIEDIDIPLEL